METVGHWLITIVETFLRLLPFPTKTGLVAVGSPDRQSPVLLTGNFGLTVRRVKRALKGIDAYLLVANSRGINVWCAATGGHLTNHDVISVLKTSGVEQRVDHRLVILPQLAATGIEGKVVQAKTGWTTVWGPVRAADIGPFLSGGMRKTEAMRIVDFPWPQRLEMSVAWAFPISLAAALVLLPWWPSGILAVAALVWGLALVIFLSFPLYRRWLRTTRKNVGFVFFDFGRHGLPLLFWALAVLGAACWLCLTHGFAWNVMLRWTVVSLIITLTLSLDLAGSTPIYKSGLYKDRELQIELDTEKCAGVGQCVDVCPTNVFELDAQQQRAAAKRADACVKCGACIVQCPCDALFFRSPTGEVVTPEAVRRFKLNMLGKRLVKEPAPPTEDTADER